MHTILGKCKEGLNSFMSRLKCALHQGQCDDMLDVATAQSCRFYRTYPNLLFWKKLFIKKITSKQFQVLKSQLQFLDM